MLLNAVLNRKAVRMFLGVNINKNPSSEGEQAVADFLRLYKELHPHVGYFTLNWGSVDVALMKQVLQGLALFVWSKTYMFRCYSNFLPISQKKEWMM